MLHFFPELYYVKEAPSVTTIFAYILCIEIKGGKGGSSERSNLGEGPSSQVHSSIKLVTWALLKTKILPLLQQTTSLE